ncbi:MAG: squalene--hopene cyclase [Pirellulales bacterium]|nr:squalene--hopene cyclase [Pirellulales bacterium]
MNLQVDRDRLAAAHQTARAQLLAERKSASHWPGELSSSPLSTATAISALILAEQGGTNSGLPTYTPGEEPSHIDEIFRGDLSEMIVHSLHWLAEQQNDDGGWGDTDRSLSNIATTMLVQAAFHLTGVPAKYTGLLERAEKYVVSQGGMAGLKKRYEGDKTFAVPIFANCALADMVPWRKVSSLPFELACLPQRFYHLLNLPVVSYAIPALVAVGQAKFRHAPPRNPLVRWIRAATSKRSLAVLEEMQPASGGFLEATPLTSFVVMCLASTGQSEHPVVRRGVEFLLASVREDGSWPIDTNLSTWNTSQALLALEGGAETDEQTSESLAWLLACQHQEQNPFTGAAPGGWAWTDLPGGVPDADDTAAALLALAAWRRRCPEWRRTEIEQAARRGVGWLLDLQNRDGGWPTFCRGWGRLPFDRSSNDITAHVLRALHVWHDPLQLEKSNGELSQRLRSATQRGLQYLEARQEADGSWHPLWFGNQHQAQQANPIYGTSKVLLMCDQLGLQQSEMARRGVQWLVNAQHANGGWGPTGCLAESETMGCSVEETALAVEALLAFRLDFEEIAASLEQGLSWLIEAVLDRRWTEPAPIGFYFAKLWYYERLYPQIFATRALASACRAMSAVSVPVGAAR